MIHAPGPLPGRPLAFLKGCSGGETCRSAPFGRESSSPPWLRRQTSPVPTRRNLTSDVSKIPNAPSVLPPPSLTGKERFGDQEQRPVTHAPHGSETWMGFPLPCELHSLPLPIPQLRGSAGLQPPEGVRPAKVQRFRKERDARRERSESRGVPGRGRLPAARNLPRGCVSAGPTWSLATRRIGGGGGCAPPAAAWPSVRPWGRGRGLDGGGAGRGRRGEEGRRGEGGAGALRKGPPGRGAPSFSRFPANY